MNVLCGELLWHLVSPSATRVYYETTVHYTDELCDSICFMCGTAYVEQSLIDECAVDQQACMLNAYVRANGGHFEHTL